MDRRIALVFVVGTILGVQHGQGNPIPDPFEGLELPPVRSNLDARKVWDVIDGKRPINFSAGSNGISIEAGYTDEEKLMFAAGGVVGLLVLIGLGCCCAKCCCGSSRSGGTTIVYQPMGNPGLGVNPYNAARTVNPGGWNAPVVQQRY